MNKVSLVSYTTNGQDDTLSEIVAHCARVSNPSNQNSKTKKNEDIIDLKPNAIDEDIADYVDEDSEQFKTLNSLKTVEKGWMVSHFVSGAKTIIAEL